VTQCPEVAHLSDGVCDVKLRCPVRFVEDQAVVEAKNGSFKGSALGKAMEIEMAIAKHRQFEEDLKNKLFYPNHMDLWNNIKARAAAMEAEFAKAAKREKDAAAKRKKDIQSAIEVVLASLAGVLLLGMVGFGIYKLREHG